MDRTRYITQAGMIAAVYAAVTVIVVRVGGVYSWGPLQFRPSEAVTVLAALTPAGIPGMLLGGFIGNALNDASLGAVGVLDIVFGGLASGLGAWWTWRFHRRTPIALAGPVIANALIVPAYLPTLMAALGLLDIYKLFGFDATGSWLAMYAVGVVSVALSEALVVYALGWPLLAALRRTGLPALMGAAGKADERSGRKV